MVKKQEGSKDPVNTQTETSTPVGETAGTQPQDVTSAAPVEGAAQPAGEAKAPAKPAVPEHLKKGNRVCASCGITEADFLAKNPRYSLCQGVDVLCYRKGDRVIYGVTLEEVNAKYPDKVGQVNDKQQPLISEVSGMGIKPGILVRGAISYKRKAVDTAATGQTGTQAVASAPASTEAAGSASPTSGG